MTKKEKYITDPLFGTTYLCLNWRNGGLTHKEIVKKSSDYGIPIKEVCAWFDIEKEIETGISEIVLIQAYIKMQKQVGLYEVPV
jgi:hypothetical protein